MKIIDCHIHSYPGPCDPPEAFLEKAAAAGVSGGSVFSVCPASYRRFDGADQRFEARIDAVLGYTSRTPGFLPYLFLDPSEKDAVRQVARAKASGVRGLKVICGEYHVADHLDPIRAAAEAGLPVMFHSGIDGNALPTSPFNRPVEFECLFAIPGLRFSLAHLGWPWYDEFIGIFGKLALARSELSARDGDKLARMYVDLTPGTPGIYRREALRHLYLTGYEASGVTMWGNDLSVNDYSVEWAARHQRRDMAILREIQDEYASGAADRAWLPDLTDIMTPAFGGTWREFNGEPPAGKGRE